MATNQLRAITVEEIKLLGFLRQNIVRKLAEEVAAQGRAQTDPWVVQAVVRYVNLGPAPHQYFDRLVWRITHSF